MHRFDPGKKKLGSHLKNLCKGTSLLILVLCIVLDWFLRNWVTSPHGLALFVALFCNKLNLIGSFRIFVLKIKIYRKKWYSNII